MKMKQRTEGICVQPMTQTVRAERHQLQTWPNCEFAIDLATDLTTLNKGTMASVSVRDLPRIG